jgi:hypothetical protein
MLIRIMIRQLPMLIFITDFNFGYQLIKLEIEIFENFKISFENRDFKFIKVIL